ncbi:MAG: helix-turn-helix domain-containing protein [Oscillospiraceae bacterium]|nr:helix-turn-helix domain-containing protein [Oscillospiraceae bacterium]
MYTNVAYLHNSLADIADDSRSLIVRSCGYYRIINRQEFHTDRPSGRKDYQLLYIAKGKGYFTIGGKLRILGEGSMILYRPDEPQHYYYRAADRTEVFWVHFTGRDAGELLRYYELPESENVFSVGTSPDIQWLYRQMIQELQLCRQNYEELLSLILRHIFIVANRCLTEGSRGAAPGEIERATHYFNENYRARINIEEYAAQRHMSACWFIRSFRETVKQTPMQYILSLRMSNAQSLLEATDCNITEIAAAVGYDDPLYFSRLFRRHTGFSPTEYRKRMNGKNK